MPDLRQPPPSRWRVVERNRRLVVIDTATGAEAARRLAPDAPAPRWTPRQLKFDGTAEIVTHRFYDDKAPRTIRLDGGSATLIGRVKLIALFVAMVWVVLALVNIWLLLPFAFVLFNSAIRKGIRRAITGWLDRVEAS